MLRRGSGKGERPVAKGEETTREPEDVPASAEWKLGGDLGRRYAAVSGDRNPIHMHALTAKPLGFPAAIAHGMWTKARCLAALESRLPRLLHRRGPLPQADPAARQGRVRQQRERQGPDRLLRPRRQEAHPPPRREHQVTTATDKTVADRSMGFGLKALNRLAGSDLLDKVKLRKPIESLVYKGSKNGFRAATAAGRTFKARPAARQTRPPEDRQIERALRRQPRRRAADVPGGAAARSPRRRSAPPR